MERCLSSLIDGFGSVWHCALKGGHSGPHGAMWVQVSAGFSYPKLNWNDTQIAGPRELSPLHRVAVLA